MDGLREDDRILLRMELRREDFGEQECLLALSEVYLPSLNDSKPVR